ncbi:MAG: bifunctional biotin--[acetyl-CoA-carboxylase] ligase/biotin operon repressor BirA [Oceanospirillaceae bacterium]|nr:bifunctional biotin--[acetyl-CoA-carboxylase] ligase/biotin operon repressor BirA [Oceanospirillaceae bacterium]
MIDLALLKILADGKFHSGTSLGKELGLGRSAVWKQMKAIESYGVEVFSVRGRGYRLPKGLDLLDVEHVRGLLSAQAKSQLEHIELNTFTDSTNLMALRNIDQWRHGALYVTEYQQAGRGRRGRTWVGSLATNLYFSLMWKFSGGAVALQGLSLLVGVSVIEALSEVGIKGVELKWPNDLLFKGRKLAGILLEMQGDASGEVSVVIGIGINVLMSESSKQASQIDQPWVDLASITDRKIDRNKLLAVILSRLIENLNVFSTQGFSAFIDRWMAVHAYQDSYVKLISPNSEIEGICRGVNEQGALLLERFGQIEAHHGGEISVRALEAHVK